MYHCRLTILLIGIDQAAEFLQRQKPLEQFEHKFMIVDTYEQTAVSQADVIIFTASAAAEQICAAARPQAKCILCTAEPQSLTASELAAVDDIWPWPLPDALLDFFFQRLQHKLKEEKDFLLFRRLLDVTINTAPDMVWYKDLIGAHVMVNDAFCAEVGKTKDDIIGRGHYYIWGLTREQYEKGEYVCLETERTVLDKRCTCVFDEQVLGMNGMRQLKTYKTPIFDEDGMIIGTVGIARDVTLEHKYRQRILEMANTDYLTGLANRRYLYQYVAKHRQGRSMTAVYIDIDNFKRVNDTYGHQVGDEAIIAVGDGLKEAFKDAVVVRLGGDEFFLLFLGACDIRKVQRCLSILQDKLRTSFRIQPLSLSAGIASTNKAEVSLDEIIWRSDAALYNAKNHSSHVRYCVYDSDMLED